MQDQLARDNERFLSTYGKPVDFWQANSFASSSSDSPSPRLGLEYRPAIESGLIGEKTTFTSYFIDFPMSLLINPPRVTTPLRNLARTGCARSAAVLRAIIALVHPDETLQAVGVWARRTSQGDKLDLPPRRQSAWSWSLTAIMLAATLLRLIGLSSQSLTMDECFERDRTEMTMPALIHDPNSFPPLYHMILKAWVVVDDSEIALRTFSLTCGLLALWALWWTVKHAVDEHVARWALLIGACSPFHIFYSQEGRVYMLYLLLSLLAVGCMLRWARDDSTRYRAWFIAIAVLGGYVHYFFAIVLATLGLIAMITFGKRFVLRQLMPVACLIGVLCSPLFLIVGNDLEYQRDLHEPRPINLAATGYTYFSLASGYSWASHARNCTRWDRWTLSARPFRGPSRWGQWSSLCCVSVHSSAARSLDACRVARPLHHSGRHSRVVVRWLGCDL